MPPLRARDLVDFSPVIDGVRYIRSDLRLFAAVFIKGGIGLLGANNVLLPILGEREFAANIRGFPPERGAILGMSLLMGARGVGALLGPLISRKWAGDHESRLRTGIFFGFIFAALGYAVLGWSASLWLAVGCVVMAHAGSSTNWVFSTTLLQIYTEDRFRGRVFAADYGLCMLGISASSYVAGIAIDAGMAPRTFSYVIGGAMLIPAVWWALALVVTKRYERIEAGGAARRDPGRG
jgi:hypothetical protein